MTKKLQVEMLKSVVEILEDVKESFIRLIKAEVIEEVDADLRGRMAEDIQVSKGALATIVKLKHRLDVLEKVFNSVEGQSMFKNLEEKVRLPLIHPGVILKEEFIDPLPRDEKASLLNPFIPGKICTKKLLSVISGDSDITESLALELGAYFSTSSKFWINLQCRYDEEIKGV